MIKKKLNIKSLLYLTLPLCFLLTVLSLVNADDMKESNHARILLTKSLEYLAGERTPPTYQGHRIVTVFDKDGRKKVFQIYDGFSFKYGGYHARIENDFKPPMPGEKGMRNNPLHPSPPDGGGRQRGHGGPPPNRPGRGRASGQGRPQEPPLPGNPPPEPQEQQPDDDFGTICRLVDFNRPDMSPVVGAQRETSKKLIKNSSHLSVKGPIDANIAGRKTYMIDVSPRNYKGGSIRLWLDYETLLPLKKERISWDNKLQYISEYIDFELVPDDEFAFKEKTQAPEFSGPMGPPERFERPVPPNILNQRLKINKHVTISAEGFDLINIRKIPMTKIPAIHYIFSDGLNTISIFHFYIAEDNLQKRIENFLKDLGTRLELELNLPVLIKAQKRNVFIVTSDMTKEDLKRIANTLALRSIEKIKEKKLQKKNQPPPPFHNNSE